MVPRLVAFHLRQEREKPTLDEAIPRPEAKAFVLDIARPHPPTM